MVEFSIIIPVYNRGEKIIYTLDSVKNQSYKNYEVIIIDDGSKDNTFQVCSSYCLENNQFYVYHYQNGGLSIARNRGIKKAIGKFILFLDSDDRLDLKTLEILHKVQEENDSDLVIFGIKYYYNSDKFNITYNTLKKNFLLNKSYIKEKILPNILNIDSNITFSIEPYAVNKLYRRKLLVNNSIYFDENRRIWEDKPFVATYIFYASNAIIIDDCLYEYISTEDSLSRRFSKEKFFIIEKNALIYEKYFGNLFDLNSEKICTHYFNQVNKLMLEAIPFLKTYNKDINECINYLFNNQKVNFWYQNSHPKTSDVIIKKAYLKKNKRKYLNIFKFRYQTKLIKDRFYLFERNYYAIWKKLFRRR